MNIKLAFDVFAVGFDRVNADVQAGGDIVSAKAVANQAEDFQLPVCQL